MTAYSTMIERPETAVPSIAVSKCVFEKDQYAKHVDTVFVFSGLMIEIPLGILNLTVLVPAGTDLS